ncbi:MAG: hypothetical protein ACUVWO_16060 [Thermodesulfobacteriota bacterium]
MKREHVFFIVILLLTALSFYLSYRILSSFLGSIVWAILLAIVFTPLFQRLQHFLKKREALCNAHDPPGGGRYRFAFDSWCDLLDQ